MGSLVYRYDMYDREPPLLLLLTVALGAGAMSLAARVEAWTLAGSQITSARGLATMAALQEESLKLLVVVAVASLARRHFNDPMDGLIYGSMAGLGMAIEESGAFLRSSPVMTLFGLTEPVRFCGHLVMGGIAGFPLGMLRVRRKGWPLALLVFPAAAAGLHFGWDWLVLSAPESGRWSTNQTAAGMALMLGGMLAYGALVSLAAGWSQRLFAPDRPAHLWGWPFGRTGLWRRERDGR